MYLIQIESCSLLLQAWETDTSWLSYQSTPPWRIEWEGHYSFSQLSIATAALVTVSHHDESWMATHTTQNKLIMSRSCKSFVDASIVKNKYYKSTMSLYSITLQLDSLIGLLLLLLSSVLLLNLDLFFWAYFEKSW